jgi:uncharacterized RDD family membrane protein YckC
MTTTPAAPEPSKYGHYAGPVTRLLAFLVDVGLSSVIFAVFVSVTFYLFNFIAQTDAHPDDLPSWLTIIIFGSWLFVYFGGSWAANGKTAGMALLGLRVVDRHGVRLRPWPALLRAPALGLSLCTFGIGLIGIVIGREHRSLQDVLVHSVVVYDWDARVARLRFLARQGEPAGAARPA